MRMGALFCFHCSDWVAHPSEFHCSCRTSAVVLGQKGQSQAWLLPSRSAICKCLSKNKLFEAIIVGEDKGKGISAWQRFNRFLLFFQIRFNLPCVPLLQHLSFLHCILFSPSLSPASSFSFSLEMPWEFLTPKIWKSLLATAPYLSPKPISFYRAKDPCLKGTSSRENHKAKNELLPLSTRMQYFGFEWTLEKNTGVARTEKTKTPTFLIFFQHIVFTTSLLYCVEKK